MLIVCLFFSAGLVFVPNVIAGRDSSRETVKLACVVAGLAILGSGCLGSPALALNALLVTVGGVICLAFGPRPWRFLKCSLGATVLSYLVLFGFAWSDAAQWWKLRDRYPFEPISDRLAYESGPQEHEPKTAPTGGASSGARSAERRAKDAVFSNGLSALESRIDGENHTWKGNVPPGVIRVRSLKHLHESRVNQFINSPGFGFARMPQVSPREVEVHEVGPIDLPPAEYEDPAKVDREIERSLLATRGASEGNKPSLSSELLMELHDDGTIDFANPRNYGYVKDRDHVAGFRPHQFNEMPQLRASEKTSNRWVVQTLELVSLLKHRPPAVYVSDHLPRMDELRHAPVRPLDRFESVALPALKSGEDLKVSYYNSDHIRMLGAVRAAEQCLQCHQVGHGHLLGAFSYKLRREGRKENRLP